MTISLPALTAHTLVVDNDELVRLCESWSQAPILALDTEFIRVDTFHPRLGLIQVCDGQANYLLDPLSITQWEPLQAILVAPNVLKSLHSCSEDLVVFTEFFGTVPSPLFDTQRAAAFLGFGFSISYQNLVKEILGLEVSKDQTRSDWLQRPLSAEQLAYAALDVACMPQMTAYLQERLATTGRTEWARQEFEQMVLSATIESGVKEWNQYYLGLGMSWRLNPPQLATLQRLCAWRERIARSKNKPRSWIARDADLIAIAERRPGSLAELQKIPELPRQLQQRFAQEVLQIIAAPHVGEFPAPQLLDQPLTTAQRAILKKLQEKVAEIAVSLGIASEVLARKKQLQELLLASTAAGHLVWPLQMQGWRRELLGKAFATILQLQEVSHD
jgi:ribonuclease D